jgi:hypothetical protein
MTATPPDPAPAAAPHPTRPRLSPAEVEAANRAEVTALLIRTGHSVYRPEADIRGEDLILRTPAGLLRPVQLKGRPTVEWERYGSRGIWMLFPDPFGTPGARDWFLVEHDALYAWVKDRHGASPRWEESWSYSYITRPLAAFLEPFSHRHW